MYALLEYASSFLIWITLLIIVFYLTRRIRNIFLYRLKFTDFVLLALFLNAVFYLLGIKATDFFTSKFDEIKFTSNEPWGVVGIEIFLYKIVNWIFIILTILLLTLRRRR